MKHEAREKKVALVLTGGGARAAYQVGVLRAIAELPHLKKNPFSIISGYSAGAINGAWIAGHRGHFSEATRSLWDTWASLTPDKIFATDMLSLGKIGIRWIKDRSFGAFLKQEKQITYLLDTDPLRRLITENIDFDILNTKIEKGLFHAISFSATDYRTGHSVAFYNGHQDIKDWKTLNRISVRARINSDHIMASSAIPIFFPPASLGDTYYGDGMIRLNSPLSSSIHLGADKLLVIGIRGPSSTTKSTNVEANPISVGEIMGTILNGLFFDSLDSDLDRIARINKAIASLTAEQRKSQPYHFREIPVLPLNPTKEVADIPQCEISRMPLTINILLKGIGVSGGRATDLLSYLAFEPAFIKSLLDSGYEDTMKRKQHILEFFEAT
jgi:NTE family protein